MDALLTSKVREIFGIKKHRAQDACTVQENWFIFAVLIRVPVHSQIEGIHFGHECFVPDIQ